MPKSSKYSAKIPDADGGINYSDEENAVWAKLFSIQEPAIRKHAAQEYLDGFDVLDLPKDRVPTCPEISKKLSELTGWSVAPVPALIGFKQFFGMLAQRTFPAASFIRSWDDFEYIEEPDIFHEVFGHTPLLTNQGFADFSQAIGVAGTRADPDDYAWLIRLYWFSIEFGLKQEGQAIKTLGSGLASSPTELVYATESKLPERREFDVLDILRTPYRIDIPQVIYFVIEGAEQLLEAAKRPLLEDIAEARKLGLHPRKYPLRVA